VELTISYQSCRNEQDFYNCGASFGNFQRLLAEYPTDKLVETIPDFHNTVKRFEALKEAIRSDKAGRAKDVQEELSFALVREKDAGALMELLQAGKMPYRVTHNDTKLNNILIDSASGEGICIIDLDTVMPGAASFDFGDSIRFGASTAAEDETDLNKVSMSIDLFDVFAKGYLSVAKEFLTDTEVESLAVGAKIMTFECGIRFLTDYLNGDTYFKIHRTHHNLDRCRTQFKLVEDMERKMDQMQSVVKQYL
jgi:Ser/Thr protein kinase RdoA (MazF antagonist)